MKLPVIPAGAQKKNTAPKLTGEVLELGTINTEKKTYKAPKIPTTYTRSDIVPRANKTRQVEVDKPAHWADTTIPGMFLDADYICNIVRSIGKKGEEIVEYDWQILPATDGQIFKFPISKFYVDNDGDLVLNAKVGDSYVCEVIINDENLAKQINADESTEGVVVRRRSTSVDANQLVEICTLSYGDWNSAFKDATIDTIPITNYIHYDRRDYQFEKDGKTKTKYCGALLCHPDALEDLTLIVKQLGAGKKSIVFNN